MAYPRSSGSLDFSMGTCPLPNHMGDGGAVNDMLVCTYDESHLVSGGRYHSHIQECRKAYLKKHGKTDLLICPYNSGHHVHYKVMDKHIIMCEGHYKKCMAKQQDPPSMSQKTAKEDKDQVRSMVQAMQI